jgi:predicted phage tail protein
MSMKNVRQTRRRKSRLALAVSHVEHVESRQYLSVTHEPAATPLGVSTTEVVAEIASKQGKQRLLGFVNAHPNHPLAKLVNARGSNVLWSRGQATSFVEVKLRAGASVKKAVEALRSASFVRWANPNQLYSPAKQGDVREFTPNDPSFPNQPHLTQIKAPAAWDVTQGDPNLIVAVLDDGVDLTHGDMIGNVYVNPGEIAGDGIDNDNNGFIDDVRGWNFADGNNNVQAQFSTTYSQYDTHGTLVSSIIGAVTNNNLGVAGVAPNVKVLPVRFNGVNAPFSSITLANSMIYASAMGAKIINLSFTWDAFANDATFKAATDTIYSRGVLWINSAGNQTTLNPLRQNYENVLLVANVTGSTDVKYTDSNWGFGIDVAAPGVNIRALYAGTPGQNLVGTGTGTSFAAAITSGVAALIWSKNPTWTREQVAAQLIGTTDNIDAKNPTLVGLLGSGRVNAERAVGATVAPPKIFRVNGLPAQGADGAIPESFSVDLRNVFNADSVVASNFALEGAGPDNAFGTSDDVAVPITLANASYKIGTNRLTFNVTGGAAAISSLSAGAFRFVAKGGPTGLRDPFGQSLDGNADGTAASTGDDFAQSFTIGNPDVPVPPAAPTNLVASQPTDPTVIGATLAWQDNAVNETGFIVERATDAAFTQNLVTTNVAANVLTTSFADLAPGTQFFFRVRATNTAGNSGYTNVATLTTRIPVNVLAAPTNLTASPQEFQQVSLRWTDNATEETKFVIQRSLASDFAQIDGTREAGANSTGFWDWSLQRGTTYYYRIRAETATTLGPWSATVSVVTLGTTPTPGGAPTNLAGAPQTGGQVSLSWDDNSSNETSFTIERSLSATFATLDGTRSGGPNNGYFWDWGLADGTTYFFRVRAETPTGPSAYTNVVSVTTLGTPTAPAAPTNLTATLLGQTGARLAWDDNAANETGYELQRATDAGFTAGLVTTTLASNATTTDVTGLAAGTTYYFRVRAVNATGNSAYATTATLAIPALPTAPVAPSGLTVGLVGTTGAVNNWIDNSDNETGFELDRSTSATFSANVVTTTLGANVTTSTLASGLTPETQYYFRVRAVNAVGPSAYSAIVQIAIPALPTAPAAPSGLTATLSGTTGVVNAWVDNSNNETGFELQRATDAGFTTGVVTTTLDPNVTTSTLASGLIEGSTYFFRIRAINAVGPSAYSATATLAVPVVPTAPIAPSGLTATLSGTAGVVNTWVDNSNNETGFELQRATDAGFTTGVVTTTLDPNVTTSTLASGLAQGTTYFFRVRAVNAVGPSAYSATATLAVPVAPTAPVAPSGLTATASTGAVALAWVDNSNNETGFEIDRATDAGFTAGLVTTTAAANATSLNVTGLADGTTYFFRVRAVNAVGPSAYSNVAQAVVPVVLPTFANAGFEAPTTTTYIYNPTGGSWAFNAFSGIQRNGSAWNAATAPEGVQTAFIQGSSAGLGTITQSLTLPAGTYAVTFRAAQRAGYSVQPLQFRVNGAPIGATISPAGTAFATYTTAAFTVPAGTASISFAATNGTSDRSTFVDAVTIATAVPTAPVAPTGFTAALLGTTGARLAWTDASWDETGFEVQRATDAAFTANVVTTNVAANAATLDVTNLDAGTYFFRVRAVNAVGPSAYTASASVVIAAIPAAPTNPIASLINTGGVRFAWTDASTNETGFEVQRATNATFTTGLVTTTVAANATSLDVTTGLAANTTYYFRVRATSAAGPSAYATAAPIAVPAVPTAPDAIATAVLPGGLSVRVTWNDRSNNEGIFQLQRATDSAFTAGVVTQSLAANTTTFDDTGLAAGTTYFYRVRAVNAGGASPYSATASRATQAALGTPSGVTATRTAAGQIRIDWVDNASLETGFEIQRSTNSFFIGTTTTTAAANATTSLITGLTAGTTYYFRVRAINASGTGSWSTVVIRAA